ncbi:GSCOCG00005523001-RA-CDS, partial [Cotesia congregata]
SFSKFFHSFKKLFPSSPTFSYISSHFIICIRVSSSPSSYVPTSYPRPCFLIFPTYFIFSPIVIFIFLYNLQYDDFSIASSSSFFASSFILIIPSSNFVSISSISCSLYIILTTSSQPIFSNIFFTSLPHFVALPFSIPLISSFIIIHGHLSLSIFNTSFIYRTALSFSVISISSTPISSLHMYPGVSLLTPKAILHSLLCTLLISSDFSHPHTSTP